MRKTAEKSTAPNLGTKRTCPQCGTKFYDFNKNSLECPKCEAKVDPESTKVFKPAPEPKKKVKDSAEATLAESEDIVVDGSDEAFESVEDLDDDDEEIVEDINTDEDNGDF